ncbi:T9SS type B sorting domain-containing protein [Flavobacterium weaverense]|nr:T9SS type B sorting domain-containing protein [Flavobacterium weaverense]
MAFISHSTEKKVKKHFFFYLLVVLATFLFFANSSYGQVAKAFSPRLQGGNVRVKGDVVFVGNSMMSTSTYPNIKKNVPDPRNVYPVFIDSDPNGIPTNLAALTSEANKNFNLITNNNGLNQEYTDIDNDPNTFASSSAELNISNDCKRILYAGLYWTAIYPNDRIINAEPNNKIIKRRDDWNQIKFKIPGEANYIDIKADNDADPVGDEDDIIFNGFINGKAFTNTPYVCYKNVTGILQGLADPNGNYFAANIRAAKGITSSGSMAGWTLVIIYESPNMPSRYISTFDGFAGITKSLKNLDFTIDGFRSLPTPLPVRATIGVAAQEGESKLYGDDLLIKANGVSTFTYVNNSLNPLGNVFNSSITVPTVITPFSSNVETRVPNSLNTLGFDMDLINVNNPNNKVIPNGETGATYRLTSTSDTYAAYLTTFAVDVIEPEIVLTKIVKNSAGVNIGNKDVSLGDFLNYEIGFKNVGNDDADEFTIKDVLPVNIIFDPNSIVIPVDSKITYTYVPVTRTLIFTIPNELVKINGNQWFIKFGVQVVPNCNDLSDACSDQIKNQAFATYKGVTNPYIITDDPSISVFGDCNLSLPSATNFLVGVDNCSYSRKYQLCGSNEIISASLGYDQYEWSLSPFVNGVATGAIIGNERTLTVTKVGTYYVRNTALEPCTSIEETITVEPFGTTVLNPVIPFASELVTCTSDGKILPNIYLCGSDSKKFIRTGINDTEDIIWEKSVCALVSGTKCADEGNSCVWENVATGPDYNVGSQGQYRITLKYKNGCFNRFFFNVYESNLAPKVTFRDIICNTDGEIIVENPQAGSPYEYSLDGNTYQSSNILTIKNPDIYTVYIRSTPYIPNTCVYTVPGIQIRKRDFTVTTTISNPLCNGEKGSIKLAANDVRGQYTFSILNDANEGQIEGPKLLNDYTFEDLNPGTYTVNVVTEDGCSFTDTVTLIEPGELTVTAVVSKSLTCENGEITVTTSGGTGPFTFFVNSTTEFQGSPLIDISTAGTYEIKVVDFNNCEFIVEPITITAIPKPEYTVNPTNIACYGGKGGILFNVIKDNGYTLEYSIDNGDSYYNNSTFSNLEVGSYTPVVKYSLQANDGTVADCFDIGETITITSPTTALTASAGVSELAGCGPNGEGKVRITNPQGGIEPYTYSFDAQNTWITQKEMYLAVGSYTIYIKDFNECIYPMDVTIAEIPEKPTISKVNSSFNCDGTSTTTVTLTNNGGDDYAYQYLLNGIVNTNIPANVFVNVLPTELNVPHIITVKYELQSAPTYSDLLNEDFGSGAPTTTPGINAAYCFENQQLPNGSCNGGRDLVNNEYSVTNKIEIPWSGWVQDIKEHTDPLKDPAGRFLAIDIGSAAGTGGILYSKTIKDIIPNKDILVDFYAINLYKAEFSGKADPNLKIELVYDLGKPSQFIVPNSYPDSFDVPKEEKWLPYKVTLNPGSYTTLSFVIRSNSVLYDGNDVGIDDIKVYQFPVSCIEKTDYEVIIPLDKEFKASVEGSTDVTCAGKDDGTVTIAAQNFDPAKGFYYSTDDGASFTNAMTSPVIVNLSVGVFKVQVSNEPTGGCVKTFDVTIEEPTPVTLLARIKTFVTCTTGATIEAIGDGGTPSYEYQLVDKNDSTKNRPFQKSSLFYDVPSGNYTVFVRDANLCIASATGVDVNVDAPTPPDATLETTSLCYDGTNKVKLTVNIAESTGILPFSYSINTGQTPIDNTFEVLPGTYTITVTDANGCTDEIDNIIVAPALKAKVESVGELQCDPVNTADIVLSVIGGTTPYKYTVNGGAAFDLTTAGNFSYDATTSGDYEFIITDALNCSTTVKANVKPITDPSLSATPTQVTCKGADNGQVQLLGSGGSGGYTYSDGNSTYGAVSLFPNLAASATAYTFYVKDSKGCVGSTTVFITEPAEELGATVTETTFKCNAANGKVGGSVVMNTPTGGTAPYTYTFTVGTTTTTGNTLTITDTTADVPYSWSVKDKNGCEVNGNGTLLRLNPPTALAFSPSGVISCNTTAVNIIVTAANGVGTLQYETIAPSEIIVAKQPSDTFSNLTAGTYTFRVTDANGCYFTDTYKIDAVTNITVIGNKIRDNKCLGVNSGSLEFTADKYAGTYSHEIQLNGTVVTPTETSSNGGKTITYADLAKGIYKYIVTDNLTGCPAESILEIIEPTTSVTAIVEPFVNANCKRPYVAVTITATGGTPNYKYAFVHDGATPLDTDYDDLKSKNLDPLDSKLWDVYVIDKNGCNPSKLDVTIDLDALPEVNLAVDQCTVALGGTFQITATPTTDLGVAPYTYTINTGQAPTGALSNVFNVPDGSYTVTVTDANGCTDTEDIIVSKVLNPKATLIKDLTCESGNEKARIDVKINGGLADFTYTVTKDGGVIGSTETVTGNTFSYYPTTKGNYQFTITDGNGCTKLTEVIPVSDPITVTASETHIAPTCNGFTDGSITLTALAGEAPFTYSIDNGANFVTSNVFGGLAAGSYDYIVKDFKGCQTVPATIILLDPAPIVPNIVRNAIQCNTNTPGSFDVNVVSGGVAPFVYRLYDNAFTQIDTYTENSTNTNNAIPTPTPVYSFTGLNFGDYYITIVDAKGCEYKSAKLRIETPPYLGITTVVDSNNCATGVDITVTTTGGTGPFRYSIFGQPTETAPLASNSYQFVGLFHNTTYFLQVKDAFGCISIKEEKTPLAPSNIKITATSSTDATCNASASGILAFTVQDYDASVTQINYEVLNALTLLPLPTAINGSLTGPAGGPVSETITTLKAGNYVLRVTEDTGTLCSTTFTFTITQPAQALTSAITASVNANCNNPEQVTLTTTGGTGPYTYASALAPARPSSFASSNVLKLGSTTGEIWNITVKDSNGCTVDLTHTITKDPTPEIALSVFNKCVAEGTFKVVVDETTAGIGAYSISVDNSTFTNITGLPYTVTALNSGLHTIKIKDVNGCIDSKDITIDIPLVATPAITTLPTCANNDGVITMSGTGGTGTYTYTISPSAGISIENTTGVISGLAAAVTYTVTMIDTATPTNCTATADVTLGAPTAVSFTTDTTPALCVGEASGTITVILGASNDNPNYTYEITAGPQLAASQPSNVFTGLLTGFYSVKVKSGRGCELTRVNVFVDDATPLVANLTLDKRLTCGTDNAAVKAKISIAGSGGAGPYEYGTNGTDFSSQFEYETATVGTFTLYVKDANGCISSSAVQIDDINPPVIASAVATPIYCEQVGLSDTTSTVTLTTTALTGFGTLTYTMLPTRPAGVTQAGNQFSGLVAGYYTFEVTDENGCKDRKSIPIVDVEKIQITGAKQNEISCNSANGINTNGSATFTVTGFSTTGNYDITVTTLPPALTYTQSAPVNDVITLSDLSAGIYTVTVKDLTTGCEQFDSVTLVEPIAIDFTATATNVYCIQDKSQITVTGVTGGTGAYSYAAVVHTAIPSAPASGSYSSSNVLLIDTNLTDLAWDVYVKDAKGCLLMKTITVILDPLPEITVVAPYSHCADVNGEYTFTVSVSGVGGFQYSIGAGYQPSPTFVVNNPGTYNVFVKDANGCVSTTAFSVIIYEPIQLDYVVDALPACGTANNGVVTLTASGGTNPTPVYEYKKDVAGEIYHSVNTFPNLAPGDYTFYARDINTGCETSVKVRLAAATPLTGFDASSTPVTCNGGTDGTITVTMDTPAVGVNDNPVYMYTLTGTTIGGTPVSVGPQTSKVFTGLSAGNYTVDVVSGRGCPDSKTVKVEEPDPIIVPTPTVVQFACAAGSNANSFATITIDPATVTGGSSTYLNYEFLNNGVLVQFGTNNAYTEANLTGGTYTVNVYDNKGCMGTANATIDPFSKIDFDAVEEIVVTKQITCNTDEEIRVNVRINSPATLLYEVKYLSGGTAGYMYSQTNSNGIFDGVNALPIGNYLITVKNLVTGCTIQTTHYVSDPNTFDLTIDSTVNTTCFEYSDGSAKVTFVDRVITATNPDHAGIFDYTVKDQTGTVIVPITRSTGVSVNLNALAAGIYTIDATLVSSPFCTTTKNFTINKANAKLTIAESHTEITCISGNDNGSIAVTASGGWPGDYEFELVGPTPEISVSYGSQNIFSNLIAGNYTINVKDSKGCVDTKLVVLSNPTPINFLATVDKPTLSCFGDTSATITIATPTGGSGTYLYTLINTFADGTIISNGPQLANSFTNLGAATYEVKVSDTWNCSTVSATPISITQPSKVTATLVVKTTQTCETGFILKLTASGGTGPYQYSADGINYTASSFDPSTDIAFPKGTVGIFKFYVRDVKNCVSIISNSIKINPLEPLSIQLGLDNPNVNCKGDATGVILAIATGGLGSYVYTLFDGANNAITPAPFQTAPGRFVGLTAGFYQVKVISGDCNTATRIVEVTEPNAPLTYVSVVTDITCYGEKNGKLDLKATGGTGVIKYSISPRLDQFFNTGVFENLVSGTYQALIQDANGCYEIYDFTIAQPSALTSTVSAGSIIEEICAGDNDGAFMIDIFGGTGPYSVSLDDINGTYSTGSIGKTTFDFTGLTGGDHYVYIKDANGCTTDVKASLEPSVNINPKVVVNYICSGNFAGNTITVTVDRGVLPADLDYALDGSIVFQASNMFTNVTPGFHIVTSRHTNGCEQQTTSFEVKQVDPLILALSDGGLNEIVATTTGGSGIYTYMLNGENYGNSSNFIIYKSGDYTISVTDSYGCTVSFTQFFTYIDVCIPNNFTPNGDGINDTWEPGCTENYKDLVYSVFDRYGRIVGTYRVGQYWDGRYKGTELPSGDYWYVLKLNDAKDAREFVGHFTLYR